MAMGPGARSRILISADSHVEESDAVWERIPAHLRKYCPTVEWREHGGFILSIEGQRSSFAMGGPAAEIDYEKEFRRDPSGGTDLARRKRDMAREGIDAEVVFPNLGLGLGCGDVPSEFRCAQARAYNDWVFELFAPEARRFQPVGLLPVDEVELAVAEAKRCIAKGFRSVTIPPSVPWRPYFLPGWEPLWALLEECGTLLGFHVFTGNLASGADFASLLDVPRSAFEVAQHSARLEAALTERYERLSSTVIGMAAGMAPIVHLISGGVLERHPELRFIVTEAECGWLAWTLQAMDQMQERRHLSLPPLEQKPSEYFLRQGAVTFTDDPVALHNLAITGSSCLLWSNDYPHDEGIYPGSAPVVERIAAQLSEADAENVFSRNAARLYGFDLDYLAAHKAELSESI